MPRLTVAAVAAALLLAAPTAARASTLNVSGGVLSYTAQAGRTTDIRLVQTGPATVTVTRLAGDNDDFGAGGPGCPADNGVATCTGALAVNVDAGDGNDTVSADGFTTVRAAFAGGSGADVFDGGDGIDLVQFDPKTTPSYSIDGVANDGAPGEGDNIGTDVEDVTAAAAPTDAISLTGSAGPNHLVVEQGEGTIVGGPGADVLEGGPQDVVSVTASAGGRTVSRRRIALHGRCGYVVRLRYARARAARLSVSARFGGTAVMRPRASHHRALHLH